MIRSASTDDHAWILTLNARHETATGKLDAAELARLSEAAFATLAANVSDGFLIALDQGANDPGPNWRWFAERHARFVYIDRIVVDAPAQGRGIGRAFHAALAQAARKAGHDRLLCEVNLDPPNPGSFAFHQALGFVQVASRRLEARHKTVAYMEWRIG
jgi:predicted GNAT superfamily acetyltransferase